MVDNKIEKDKAGKEEKKQSDAKERKERMI